MDAKIINHWKKKSRPKSVKNHKSVFANQKELVEVMETSLNFSFLWIENERLKIYFRFLV